MKKDSIEVTLKNYTHTAQVLADSKLIDTTNNVINAIFHSLRNRPALPKGQVYIKSLYEKMNDDDQFNAEFLIQEYVEIRMKKSNLSSQRRDVVADVVDQAIIELIDQNKLIIVPGSIFIVKNERALLKIIGVDKENNEVIISFKKKKETWDITKLIEGINSNILTVAYDKDKEGL